jgi:hypothetical protein
MKLDRWSKYGTVVLLGLGYIVTAAGGVRTYYTWKLYYDSNYDYTWMQYPAFLASAVENDLAVVRESNDKTIRRETNSGSDMCFDSSSPTSISASVWASNRENADVVFAEI